MRKRACATLALALAALTPVPAATQSSDERAVLAVVETLFEGMRTKDVALLERTMTPEASLVATSGDDPGHTTRDEFISAIAGLEAAVVERMWSPEVRTHGGIASVWAPYDIYVGGTFSHCGIDAFHLVRVEGSWKIAGITYSRAQPPDCDRHPDGPPRGLR